MKRRIVIAGIGAALALAGCKAPVERADADEARLEGGWTASARITAVERQGGGLIVRGDAPPGARVVLRGDQDTAYAAGADASGRFEMHILDLSSVMLLRPEVQTGQFPASGPERLLVAGDGEALAALVIEGGPSRRLSAGPALDSVDGDGRGLVAAGRARPGATVSVSAYGGAVAQAVANADGRWATAVSNVGDRPVTIRVDGEAFDYPGPSEVPGEASFARSAAGWRLTRRLSAAAWQTSWFPDA